MKNRHFLKRYLQPVIISLGVFFMLFLITNSYTQFRRGQWEKDIRSDILSVLTGKKSNLEKSLFSRIFYTRGVAAYVSLHPQISNNEFSELAREYIRNDSVISTMALSKDCILNVIYPVEGHEAAIGLNLLDHPERKEIVEKTIETHLTFVAGPVELVEGGLAFISYTPVFDKSTGDENKFWGVTDIVIKQTSLINEAGLKNLENGYLFALRGYNGTGKNGGVFWGEEQIFENDPVTVNIELPIGNWELAAVPEKGWNMYPDQDKTLAKVLFISAFIISLLVGLFSKALFEIRNNEKELKAVFNSIDSLIMEFSATGEFIKINSGNQELLYMPVEKLKGKNLKNIFDRENAEKFMKAISECIATKQIVELEYPLQINESEHWFYSRISCKNEHSVIFNAYDITKRKNQEKLLIESEKQLKELNEMKNKFFSVIAHDIKGPLGAQNSLIKLLETEVEKMDKETQLKLIHLLKGSSENLMLLLEDLLNWSLSQSGKIEAKIEKFSLFEIVSGVVNPLLRVAQAKKIEIAVNPDMNTEVFGDINFTKTIIRNLLTNAIKFSYSGGKIDVYTEKSEENGKLMCKIVVADHGTGMEQSVLDSLFLLDKTQARPGTSNETGNGLGLVLCSEFAQKQNTKMKVQSKVGEGSRFSFMLPFA